MLARYKLCYGPVFVRPSVWLVVQRDPRRDVVVNAAYCYRRAAVAWSVHPCGLLLQTRSCNVVGPSMRPIVTDAQLWRVWSIHAVCCYWVYGRTTGWPTYRLCLAFLVLLPRDAMHPRY